jgi:hypothetical protein
MFSVHVTLARKQLYAITQQCKSAKVESYQNGERIICLSCEEDASNQVSNHTHVVE